MWLVGKTLAVLMMTLNLRLVESKWHKRQKFNLLPSTTVRPHGRFRACHAQAFRTPRLQTPLHTPSLLYNRTLSPFQTSFLSRRAPILIFFLRID